MNVLDGPIRDEFDPKLKNLKAVFGDCETAEQPVIYFYLYVGNDS